MDCNGNGCRIYVVRHKAPGTVKKAYGPDWDGDYRFYIDTDEPEHAVKVANERRMAKIISAR